MKERLAGALGRDGGYATCLWSRTRSALSGMLRPNAREAVVTMSSRTYCSKTLSAVGARHTRQLRERGGLCPVGMGPRLNTKIVTQVKTSRFRA